MTGIDDVHHGGCQCGRMRYAIAHALHDTAHCHCRMCQRAVGAAVVTWTTVPFSAFAWTSGVPAEYRSSPTATRTFCPACGTSLTFALDGDAAIDVTVATLDDPDAAPADRNIWTESRLRLMKGFDRDLPDLAQETPAD
ncbi:GFA family protein [Amorphus sp. MBR-141]